MRRALSTKQRKIVFERAQRQCHICSSEIRVGEAWEVEHIIPIALGGADELANMAPAHIKCHAGKTRTEDIPAIARAKRREAVHLGLKQSRNPLPGGRKSPWKKRMDGTVVRRNSGD